MSFLIMLVQIFLFELYILRYCRPKIGVNRVLSCIYGSFAISSCLSCAQFWCKVLHLPKNSHPGAQLSAGVRPSFMKPKMSPEKFEMMSEMLLKSGNLFQNIRSLLVQPHNQPRSSAHKNYRPGCIGPE